MSVNVAVAPVGKMDPAEVEAAAARIGKVLNTAVTVRPVLPVPRAGDDPARGQHLAGPFLAELATKPAPRPAPGSPPVDATLFVTDVDLYKPQVDGVFGDIDAVGHAAVLSVRRLREAFYKRKADPARQRSRLVKLALYAIGRVRGLPDCRDPACAMTATTALTDIDMKPEKYCAACWRRLTTGAFRI
jgi:archaemetzincin